MSESKIDFTEVKVSNSDIKKDRMEVAIIDILNELTMAKNESFYPDYDLILSYVLRGLT